MNPPTLYLKTKNAIPTFHDEKSFRVYLTASNSRIIRLTTKQSSKIIRLTTRLEEVEPAQESDLAFPVQRAPPGVITKPITNKQTPRLITNKHTTTAPNREASPSRYGANRGGVGSRRPPATPHLTERILRQSREAESALADALVSPKCTFN